MSRSSQTAWVASGVVYAPVDDTWQALLDNALSLSVAEKQALMRHTGAAPFAVTVGKQGEGRTHIVVDKRQHTLTMEGEWWYRGVTSVEPHQHGSLVVYRVFNIAPGLGWWAAQLVQGPAHARVMKDHLRRLLASIGNQLGSRTEFV